MNRKRNREIRKPLPTPAAIQTDKPAKSRAGTVVCALLVATVFAVFYQTASFDFVNYDDDVYVCQNPPVQTGITAPGVKWAFTSFHCSNWHPLTWLSHMADCEMFGLRPGLHHLTNVFIHAVTSTLLFLLLRRMTGRFWPSAFVAFLFAIHPLRAESVAWVAERKDLLSGFFFILTLWAYVSYAKKTFSPFRYAVVIALFALGLMSKPMLVTLPCVLLLLDYWPLERMNVDSLRAFGQSFKRLIIEKIPLFTLSAAACAVTIAAQRSEIATHAHIPFLTRLENAIVSFVSYFGMTLYPENLAVLYPYPKDGVPTTRFMLAAVTLVAITTATIFLRKRSPYLLMGWLWFLGMLVPTIGLVQVGEQSMADRYTYLPQIGLLIALVWGAAAAAQTLRISEKTIGAATGVLIATLACLTALQTSYWRNSLAVWTHAAECTSQNYVAHNNIAGIYLDLGIIDNVVEHCEQSLKFNSDNTKAHFNLGLYYSRTHKYAEAIKQYSSAIQCDSTNSQAYFYLALSLQETGKSKEAIPYYEKGISLDPENTNALNNYGQLLDQLNKPEEALRQYSAAFHASPDFLEAYLNYIAACEKANLLSDATVAAKTALAIARTRDQKETIRQLKDWLAKHANK